MIDTRWIYSSSAIRYVGVDDVDLDLFESQYAVPEGMAYNAYVILDDAVALIDTVDQRKVDTWLKNVDAALEGRTPDFLVCHHMEPDHASGIAKAVERWPELTVVMSAKAQVMLGQFNPGLQANVRTVAEGDRLELGAHTLQFVAAPMVHWPEVLMSYEVTEQILFSADGFGKFSALQNETDDWACEARRYYFNICGKYGAQVQAVMRKLSALPPVKAICPLHGPALKENLDYYLGLYDTWSQYKPETDGVLVAYASIHGGTAEAAKRLAALLQEAGAKKVAVADLSRDDMAEAIEDAFRYGRLVLCAASYDGDVFPPMHDFLYHLVIKGYRNRRVGYVENGSWAPCAARVMRELVGRMKNMTEVEPIVTLRSRMTADDESALRALAEAVMAE